VIDLGVNRMADHIETLVSLQRPEMQEHIAHWYRGGHAKGLELGRAVGTEAAGPPLLASQSPSKPWPMNLDLGERMVRGWNELAKKDAVFTRDIFDQYAKTRLAQAMRYKADQRDAAVTEAHADIAQAQPYVGRRWSELPEMGQAIFMRAESELSDPAQGFSIYDPYGRAVARATTSEGTPAKLQWQSYDNIIKGLRVLGDPSPTNIWRAMGEGHKVPNFSNNLTDPYDPRWWTSDTHNIGGSFFQPMGGEHPFVKVGLGQQKSGKDLKGAFAGQPGFAGIADAATGISGTYPLYHEAGQRAAARVGRIPNQVQSISWESIKGLFSPAQRRDAALMRNVHEVWSAYERGGIPFEEAQHRVFDMAGGVRPPDWLVPGWTPPAEAPAPAAGTAIDQILDRHGLGQLKRK
jgi:hypothetical protein